MPTPIFGGNASSASPESVPARGSRLPADYYSAPLSEVRPIFPRWVPYGCGAAAAVFILLLLGAGALLSGPKLAQGVDFIVGMSLGDLRSMFTPEVTTEQRDRFEREVKAMRDGLTANRVEVAKVQPFLQAMSKAIA